MKQQSQAGLTTLQIIIGLTVVAVLFALISTFMGSNDEQEMAGTAESTTEGNTPLEEFAENRAAGIAQPVTDAVEAQNDMMREEMDGSMDEMDEMEAEDAAAADGDVSMGSAGTFTDYSEDKLALSSDGTVVLFFHADWCPSCRGLEDDLNANLTAIPENTHILKLDYDSETELKRKYGVVRQHTLVVVDANGNEIKKLTGLTNTLDQVVGQL